MTYITHISDKIINYSLELKRELIIIIIILSIMVLFFPYSPEVANGQVNQNQVVSAAQNSSSERVPWIGAELRNVSKGIANVLGMDEPIGVLVIEVSPGSPAEEAGLVGGNESVTEEVKLGGDIIIKADNKSVTSKNDFNRLLRQKSVGDNLTLTVLRADQRIDIPITIGSRPGFIYESSSIYADSGNIDFAAHESFDLEFEISYPIRWEKAEEESNSILFETNPENSTDNFREFVEVRFEPLRGNGSMQEKISRNETIRNMENRLHERTSGAYTSAVSSLIVGDSSNTTFAGNPARIVEYNFILPPVGQISAKDIFILDDNELYSVRYLIQSSKLDNYLPTIETMIRSFNISEVQKYENFDMGVRLEHFEDWIIDETEDDASPRYISFRPPTENKSSAYEPFNQPSFEILQIGPFQDRSVLEDLFNDTIEILKIPSGREIHFKLINSSLGHLENMNQLHNVTYSYGDPGDGRIIYTRIVTVESNGLYVFLYRAPEEVYSNSAPVINKMIKSIEFFTTSPSSHATKNLGLLFEYPSDMSIVNVVDNEDHGSITFSLGSDIDLYDPDVKPEFVINVCPKENTSDNEMCHDISGQDTNKNITYVINTTSKQPVDEPHFTYGRDDNHATLEVYVTFNNTNYNFVFRAGPSEYEQFIATIEEIINSTKIIDSSPFKYDGLNAPKKSVYTHYDSEYGFTMKYPLDLIDAPNDLDDGVVEFKPKTSGENTTLSVRILAIPAEDRKIYDFVEDDISSYTINNDDFMIIRSNSTNHDEHSAYELHFIADGYLNMSKYIFNEKNNHLYKFNYGGEIDEYHTFFPIAEEMMESLELTGIKKSRTNTGFKVGDDPFGIAVNPRTNTIYVANRAAQTLSAINSSNNELLSDIVVGNAPSGIAINPVKNTVYVTHVGLVNGSISVIDGKNNTRIANIPLDMKSPISVAANPSTDMIYVADSISKNVSVIDGSTNKIIDSIATGQSQEKDQLAAEVEGIGIAVDSVRNRIYVANPSTNITVIDGSDNSILANISIPKAFKAFDIAVNPYTNVGYIIGEGELSERRLVAIDLANNRMTPYNVTGTGLNVVALHPFSNNIYINDWDKHVVYAINATNDPNDPPAAINLDLSPIFLTVDPDANIIYVTNIGSDTVSKINGATSKVIYGVRFEINDKPINLPIFLGQSISVNPSKSINIECNGASISDNDYVHYDDGTQLKCSVNPKHPFTPLITSSLTGFDRNPSNTFTITRYETITASVIDLESLLQTLGPYISLIVLAGVVLAASMPSFSPRIRKVFSAGKEQTTTDRKKKETPIIEKPDIITADATVIIGVLIFIGFSEGFELAEQTQITIITVNIVFPFAISAVLAVRNYDKFAIRLMIAGFINLMISVILIAIMRL